VRDRTARFGSAEWWLDNARSETAEVFTDASIDVVDNGVSTAADVFQDAANALPDIL
jgi:hypothetical protein